MWSCSIAPAVASANGRDEKGIGDGHAKERECGVDFVGGLGEGGDTLYIIGEIGIPEPVHKKVGPYTILLNSKVTVQRKIYLSCNVV